MSDAARAYVDQEISKVRQLVNDLLVGMDKHFADLGGQFDAIAAAQKEQDAERKRIGQARQAQHQRDIAHLWRAIDGIRKDVADTLAPIAQLKLVNGRLGHLEKRFEAVHGHPMDAPDVGAYGQAVQEGTLGDGVNVRKPAHDCGTPMADPTDPYGEES